MIGNDRMRFCGTCEMNVYNLSGMSRDDAESLVAGAEGRLCVRFYRRADGSVMTSDCPVGWALMKRRARVFTTAVASLVVSFLGAIGIVSIMRTSVRPEVGRIEHRLSDDRAVMGAIAHRPEAAGNEARSEWSPTVSF